MAQDSFNPEFNYYPTDMQMGSVSAPESSVEKPQSNTPSVQTNPSNVVPSANGSQMPNGVLKSSNYVPNVAGWLLDSNGNIYGVAILTQGGRIANWYINTNTIASGSTEAGSNVLIDSLNSLIRLGPISGSYITLDGANLRIRSSNYSDGVSGFTIEPTLIEAENLVARGTMRGVSFKYDAISAVGGQLMVANSDVLASDMTALDSATLTVRGDSTFAVNDILVIRGVATSGIQEEWFRVTNAGSAPTYTVTRDLASSFAANSNPTWKAGTPIVKQGSSNGVATYSGGWLRLIGEGSNSPYYSVFARTGVAYNSYTEACRLGNLNGIGGFSADTYGIFIGNYSSGKYLTYDNVSGDLNINGYVQTRIGVFGGDGSDGALSISSGTTTIDLGGVAVFIKYYSSISITGTAKLAFSNPHTNGTIIIFKCTGNCTITSSTVPCVEVSGLGGAGGAGGSGTTVNGTAGNSGIGNIFTANAGGGGIKSPTNTGGTGGSGVTATSTRFFKIVNLVVGGGGGGGATGTGTGGTGGRGGGALYLEVKGALNFTGTINANGAVGGNGTTDSAGGGGGGGGSVEILYNSLTANTGTINTNGGVGGTTTLSNSGGAGGGGGSVSAGTTPGDNTAATNPGGTGGNGYSIVAMNNSFA